VRKSGSGLSVVYTTKRFFVFRRYQYCFCTQKSYINRCLLLSTSNILTYDVMLIILLGIY
jgi:hypothetical protein